MDYLLTAIALMLVLEGILPALSPASWRKFMLQIASLDDAAIRGVGVACMVLGAALMTLVHQIF